MQIAMGITHLHFSPDGLKRLLSFAIFFYNEKMNKFHLKNGLCETLLPP